MCSDLRVRPAMPLSIDEYFFHLAPVPSLFKIISHNIVGFLFNFNNFLLRRPEGYEKDIVAAAAVSSVFLDGVLNIVRIVKKLAMVWCCTAWLFVI